MAVNINEFAQEYEKLKSKGMIPMGIMENICENFGIGKSMYYRILHDAREEGYVTDSYEENMAARIEREKKIREMKKNNALETQDHALSRTLFGEDAITESDNDVLGRTLFGKQDDDITIGRDLFHGGRDEIVHSTPKVQPTVTKEKGLGRFFKSLFGR